MELQRVQNADFIDGGTPPDYWIRYALYAKMTPRERGRTNIFTAYRCDKCCRSGGPMFSERCDCGRTHRPVSIVEALALS